MRAGSGPGPWSVSCSEQRRTCIRPTAVEERSLMNCKSLWGLLVAVAFIAAAGAVPGCSCGASQGVVGDGGKLPDGGGGDGNMGLGDGGVTACGDNDPSCMVTCVGPTCTPPNQ